MDDITRYAAVNTKIRTIEGKLLSSEDYYSLLHMKSVSEIANYLKHKTHYNSILYNIDSHEMHRSLLEVYLKRNALASMEKVMYYFNGEHKKFIKTVLMRYEIEDLKILIRAINTNNTLILKNSLVYIGKYSSINYDELAESNNFSEIITKLKDTVYYNYLKSLIDNKPGENQFQIEMSLDLAYYDIMHKHIKSLSKQEQQTINQIQGMLCDLLNLKWIYRGLKFYTLPPEVLINYTIHFGKHIKYRLIKEICYSKNSEEMEDRLSQTPYRFLFQHKFTKDILMERRIFRYQYMKLMSIKRSNMMNLSQVLIYFQLLEYEIRDIISIIENIRYNTDDLEESKRYLISKI